MLWQHYVLRRGTEVQEMWESLFDGRDLNIVYVTGRGFDTRAQSVLKEFVETVERSAARIKSAKLLLVEFSGYDLSEALKAQTESNARRLNELFSVLGHSETLSIGTSAAGEDDLSASNALRIGTERVLGHINGHTDIIIDVSSMPRLGYLSLITGVLHNIVAKERDDALEAGGVNLQVLVAEDVKLDSQIRSEDPSNDLVMIPGFSAALHAESMQEWPLVWFPVLGENRIGQLEKVLTAIPPSAEICPVLPHPSRDPRRGDQLLVEYRHPLFVARETPIGNILYAHERNPFEAYRQILTAMQRYVQSLKLLGGCRLVVTPLGSKLMTIAAGLACFEIRPSVATGMSYGVAIPYAGPTRYVAEPNLFTETRPEITALLLTGRAYSQS